MPPPTSSPALSAAHEPPAFPVLRTDRLVLREIEAADIPALFEMHQVAKWDGARHDMLQLALLATAWPPGTTGG
jgi:hypothetical protein